ncbi:MAG: MgtC/SapB family protein [Myxococcales bacterium]|nr:MgtC/SapB family protein [Myxococcales bacterium]
MALAQWRAVFDAAFLVPIAVAIFCGGAIGIERQMRGKPIGIRTSILICLGTQIVIRLGSSLAGPTTDPSRVLGQVVTGIGFLGAGVILARGQTITGVTSAAVVWVLAGIGAAIGLDRLAEAAFLSIVTVGILFGVRVLETAFQRLRGGSDEPDNDTDATRSRSKPR